MLGYKNRSFEYSSLINSLGYFSRISDGHPYPFYPEVPPPPPPPGLCVIWNVSASKTTYHWEHWFIGKWWHVVYKCWWYLISIFNCLFFLIFHYLDVEGKLCCKMQYSVFHNIFHHVLAAICNESVYMLAL